ncbi:MAG: hypothetical protein II640_01525, partial [Lachnospiraceae bacterium]|nr:hypothetical protein [Lachnospiraceae bacterium]
LLCILQRVPDASFSGRNRGKVEERLNLMKQASVIFSVCAMADESAFFIRDTQVTCLGEIHWIEKGEKNPSHQT